MNIPAIMVVSGKGGVGKTLVSVNLAMMLASHCRVALIDMDILNPNITDMMGINGNEMGLTNDRRLIPYKYTDNIEIFSMSQYYYTPGMKMEIAPDESGQYDFVRASIEHVRWNNPDIFVIDTDPSSRNIIPPLKQILGSNLKAVMVVENVVTSLSDAERMYDKLYKRDIEILGVIANRVIDNHDELVRGMCEKFKIPYLGAIPFDPDLQRRINQGDPTIRNGNAGAMRAVEAIVLANIQ